MSLTLGMVGDTMLGRQVARRIRESGTGGLLGEGVLAAVAEADLLLANLECCVSARGERWPDPHKAFFFRAPPEAVEILVRLGVDVVTLANNHALDFGAEALADTRRHLEDAGIAVVGAGRDRDEARRPVRLEAAGHTVGVVGLTDHPEAFAAGPDRSGVAWADLRTGLPGWVGQAVAGLAADLTVVTPHWGPNMVAEPVPHVRRAARRIADETAAGLVAGHSAHVFHGVESIPRQGGPLPVLYDLGDFLDDYRVDQRLRNDLGLLWLVRVEGARPVRVTAVPLHLRHCRTVLAEGQERAWVAERLTRACRKLGTSVDRGDDRLRIDLSPTGDADG